MEFGRFVISVVFKHYADAAGRAFTNVGMTQYDQTMLTSFPSRTS